jgi:hypothetical protein
MTRKTFSLILLWVFVIGLGFTIGLAIGFWLETEEDYFPIFLLLGLAISGALIGFGQWLLFETDQKSSWLWIPAMIVGMPLGLLVGFFAIDFLSWIPEEPYWLNLAVIALVAGAITGIFQWLFTGKKLVNAKWIFVSAIGFLGLAFFYPSTDNPIYFFETEYWVLNLILYGSLFGIFAGIISGVFILPKLGTQHIKARILNWQSLTFLAIILLASFGSKLFLYDNGYDNPLYFSQYSTSGYYEIYPDTTLDSLTRQESNVLIPATEEIWNRDEPEYDSIHWSQSDYLKIANLLSQEVWHEPLDLNEWKVLNLSLTQDCVDNPKGFYDFRIVYFQNLGIQFWRRQFHVRLIEVYTSQGIIRWGDTTFSDAILPGWGNVELNDFKLTADDALLIAENNGGRKTRQEVDDACMLSVRLNNYSPVNGYTNNNWIVDYYMTDFYLRIDPFSGEFRSTNLNQ